MVFEIDPQGPQSEPLHSFTAVGYDTQDPIGVLERPEAETPTAAVLDSDQHAVESCEIESRRNGRRENGRPNSPPLQRFLEGESEARLAPGRSLVG